MSKYIHLDIIDELKAIVKDHPQLITVILGPRQVGKTTSVLQFLEKYKGESLYFSSDEELSPQPEWLADKWQLALAKSSECLLIIDEVQRIPQWSTVIKNLWDKQKRTKKSQIKLVLLGSSSLQIQKGLSESLSGRFYLISTFQWDYKSTKMLKKLSLEDFIHYGGYPGSYSLLENKSEWENYIRHSIVETVIGKDILTQAKVSKPALFRQSFGILMSYPAQEISYTKLLGQLQDSGNTDLIKYYIELFEGAYLIKSLHKYSPKSLVTKTSSPKLIPMCGALINRSVFLSKEGFGRALEAAVGSALVKCNYDVFYWRDKNYEVDFIIENSEGLLAIEVKSGLVKNPKGLNEFCKRFKNAIPIFISKENIEQFLLDPKKYLKKMT